MGAYPIRPEQWGDTEIVVGINPLTGLEEDDDASNKDPKTGYNHGGYRAIKRLNAANVPFVDPLVIPAVDTAKVYQGESEYDGSYDASQVLEGGLKDGALVVTETQARTLEYLNKVYCEYTEYEIVALDGFRSMKRQAKGWNRLRKRIMSEQGGGESTVSEIYSAGLAADDIFSVVNADDSSKEYKELEAELRADLPFMQEVEDLVSRKYEDGEVTPDRISDLLFEYISFISNAEIAQAKDRKIPLNGAMMAHNSAVSTDFWLRNRSTGRIVSPWGFDMPNREGLPYKLSRMDAVDKPGSYEAYRNEALVNPGHAAHLKSMGKDPNNFTRSDFEELQRAQRIWVHGTRAVGMSRYLKETWHVNGTTNPRKLDGTLLITDTPLSKWYWENRNTIGSNTCHTHLTLGPTGVAANCGSIAEELARKHWGLGA